MPAIPKTGKQPAVKSKCEVHTKELAFTCLSENYVPFMQALLKHVGKTKWKVSDQQRFKFKYPGHSYVFIYTHVCSQSNYAYSKTDALDVEKESEYKELVSKITENQYWKVNIIVDIDNVKRGA